MKKLSWYKHEADRLYSLLRRQTIGNPLLYCGLVKCCTCNKVGHWRDMDLGHFRSRTFLSTRFEDKNTAVQCKGCNKYKNGEPYLFGKYLDRVYGEGTADAMVELSRQTRKISRVEYEGMIDKYKQELKDNGWLLK